MTMQQVIYALEVASAKSISRAAERLYISQPALSQQILKLEEELGFALFGRTSHGILPTEKGAAFLEEAAPVAAGWKALSGKWKGESGQKRMRLRLGIGARVYSNRLFSHILAYFDATPEIEVTFVTEAGQDVLAALRNGELDLALDRLPVEKLPQSTPFFATELIRERQCILLSRDDPRARRETLSFSDLQGGTVMSGLENSAEDRMLKTVCRQNGIRLNRIIRSDGIETNMRLVREGRGVALGPESFAPYYGVAAVPLNPENTVALQFICLKSDIRKLEIRRFREYLQDVCQRRLKKPDGTSF